MHPVLRPDTTWAYRERAEAALRGGGWLTQFFVAVVSAALLWRLRSVHHLFNLKTALNYKIQGHAVFMKYVIRSRSFLRKGIEFKYCVVVLNYL